MFLAIGLAAAIVYYVYLKGGASFGKVALFILPAVILASVLNPLIVHQGETMLWYLPNGNPVTLEAVIYGIGAGFMLASVISWFASFQEVMTSGYERAGALAHKTMLKVRKKLGIAPWKL